jgi:dephospho-CoA kinase
MVVGVTGGYCSGKTLACSVFEASGFSSIDVDCIGHEVLEEMKDNVAREFGETVLKEGRVDRKALGTAVFRSPEKKSKLEEILHPSMIRIVEKRVRGGRDSVINAALLIEMRLHRLCDFVIALQTDEEVVVQRGMKRDGISREEVLLRIGSQIPIKEKLQYVDKVIDNSGTVSELLTRVRRTMESFIEKG